MTRAAVGAGDPPGPDAVRQCGAPGSEPFVASSWSAEAALYKVSGGGGGGAWDLAHSPFQFQRRIILSSFPRSVPGRGQNVSNIARLVWQNPDGGGGRCCLSRKSGMAGRMGPCQKLNSAATPVGIPTPKRTYVLRHHRLPRFLPSFHVPSKRECGGD